VKLCRVGLVVSGRAAYPSDLTDAQWSVIGPFLDAWKARHPSVSGQTPTGTCRRRCSTRDYIQITFPKTDWKKVESETHPGNLGPAWYSKAMETTEDFYDKSSGWAKTRSTVQLSLVDVKVNGKTVPRVVGFVSSAGIDENLRKSLEDLGVTLYQAKPGTGRLGKGHSEAAAAAFRRDVTRQIEDLGGEIEDVKAFVGTVKSCSKECAEDANEFVRPKTPEATITGDKTSYGTMLGKNLDDSYVHIPCQIR